MTSEAFFDAVALPSLVAEVGVGATDDPRPSATIEAIWGAALRPDLAKLLDVLGRAPAAAEVTRGSFYAFPASDFLPPRSGSSFSFMLGEWFRRIALLTQTIPVGNTGGGDVWFAEAHPDRSRVFVLDHDEMRLSIIADSTAAFAHLVHLENETNLREIAPQEWAPLEGRVRGGRDISLPKGFRPLDSEAGRDLSDRAAAVDELLGCLWYGHEPRAKPNAPDSEVEAGVRIEQLVRAFLRCEDKALARLLEASRDHDAAVVRDACAFLDAQRGAPDREQRQRILVPKP